MIPFNVFGHTKRAGAVDEIPIVWVDAQDATTYTLSGNDVLTLDNKGSLGGAMTLNGSVKFANGGFEAWVNGDFITRDLGEPFLSDNSFTFATTFDFKSSFATYQIALGITPTLNINEIFIGKRLNYITGYTISGGDIVINEGSISFGLKTTIISYDLPTNTMYILNSDGAIVSQVVSNFNNIADMNIVLLDRGQAVGAYHLGQNNPLHEFRLYNRAFTLPEMQTLQTELNNKYTP